MSMHISWNEVRVRAATFAADWKSAYYEKGETQTFYNDFRQVATFEEPVKRLGDKMGFIDLFWEGVLLIEQKSAWENLTRLRNKRSIIFQIRQNTNYRVIFDQRFSTFRTV